MNAVYLNGRIHSDIERVTDQRRQRARFLLRTDGGDSIAVEVRGTGVERMVRHWHVGDAVHVHGRITSTGLVAADTLQRFTPDSGETLQAAWPLFHPVWVKAETDKPQAAREAA